MRRRLALLLAVASALACTLVQAGGLPPLLSQSGFTDDNLLPFSPQYPLWSDGTSKRRWISLPQGTRINGSDKDAWVFPVGTRFFKEFALDGRKVETRVIERVADGWEFGVYVWRADGSDAELAPEAGIAALPVPGAPGGRYVVPSRYDCLACHEGASVPVLGFTALQLSPDRDALAPHADETNPLDLRELVRRGLIEGLPASLLDTPPRIAAGSPLERAALGYLHANCGHCHGTADQSVPVALRLAQKVQDARTARAALGSMLGAPSRFRAPEAPDMARIVVPGRADDGVLPLRMRSRDPRVQMPPVGTRIPDPEGLALIGRWIESLEADDSHHKEK